MKHMVLFRIFLLSAAMWIVTMLSGCDYASMRNDEAVDLYQISMPVMPEASVPITGGINELRIADVSKMKNPLPETRPVIRLGEKRYHTFCGQCHGPDAQGYGTVGQSFAPLPTNLRGKKVRNLSDGLFFYRTALGFKRHPPLFYTVAADDIWAIQRYIRQLAQISPDGPRP